MRSLACNALALIGKARIAILLALALVGCSPFPAPTDSPDLDATPVIVPTIFAFAPTPTPLPTSTPSPTVTPTPPQPVAIPLPDQLFGQIDTLHPFYATSPAARTVLGALFVGCIGQDERGDPLALGCERVPTADNGGAVFIGEGADRFLQVTFTIRPGWRWTDGTPVTARDAVYAWQLIMSPEAGLRDPLTQSVFSMVARDDRTVVVNFMSANQARAAAAGALRGEVPFEYFSQLGDYASFAERDRPLAPANYWAVLRWLPEHVLGDIPPTQHRVSSFAARPIGDGAFALGSAADDRILLLPADPAFPLGRPGAGGIAFILGDLPDGDQTAPAIWLDRPPVSRGDDRLDAQTAVQTLEYPAGLEQLVLNVGRFPFDDARVRQAVAHAIDRAALVRDAGGAVPADAALAYDPARARALLAEAGWVCEVAPCQKAFVEASGATVTRTLTFKLTTTEREPRNTIAQLIQKQLAAVGFGVDIEIVFGLGKRSKMFAPYEQGGILLTRNFDAALYQTAAPEALSGQFGCASIPTRESHDASRGNASGFCDPAVDALIAEAEGGESVISPQANREARARAIAAIQQAAPYVPLYVPARTIWARGVGGVRPTPYAAVTWNAWEWQIAGLTATGWPTRG